MHAFNYHKFMKNGQAITKDGSFKVIRYFLSKDKRIHVVMKSIKDFAGLINKTYNLQGELIDMYGNTSSDRSRLNLVNE